MYILVTKSQLFLLEFHGTPWIQCAMHHTYQSFSMRDKRYSDKHRGSPVRMNYIVLLPEHLSSSAFVLIQARVHL